VQDLAIYSKAKQAIAEYKTVDEVKDFRDKALAIEAYAKQANDMELEWDAARARVRAERKCGELLAEMEKAKGGRPEETPNKSEGVIEEPKTIEEMGLTYKQSSDFQKLAAVPEEEFEKAVDNPAAKPSTSHIIKPKEPPPPRMDANALYLWGVLREFRSRNLFASPLNEIVSEWTEAMQGDALSIIPEVKKWVDNYGE
jgi:hypothetical protein